VDLRPQLLELEYLEEAAVAAALGGGRIPVPRVLQPGTALLRFKGAYSGAGGLSVDGMAMMLGAAAGVGKGVLGLQVRHRTHPE